VLFWLLGPVILLFRSTAPQPAAAAMPNGKGKPAPAPPQADSTREVIETVVFVVVLVLLLKSFTAEAFVIPTGSMAQTLLGYNKDVTCPTCKIKFPVNCSSEVDPSEGPPTWVHGCTCPNCRQRVHFFRSAEQRQPQDWKEHNPDSVEIPDPGWRTGDRVLVAKFVYDLLERAPNRLDVVVFKFPGDRDFPAHGPVKRYVPMNYIKRLIGLPGETIAIYKGKLYHLSPDQSPHYDDLEKAAGDPNKMALLWQPGHMHTDDKRAEVLFRAGKFQIIRKGPEVILAMRRLVYDNDHPAQDLTEPHWRRWVGDGDEAEQAWAEDTASHSFRHSPDGDAVRWLRYRHVLRTSRDAQPQLITDFMGYNTWEGGGPHAPPGENWASDLLLECEAVLSGPGGELTLEVSKGPDRFQARFDLAGGTCALYRIHKKDKPELLGRAPTRVNRAGTYRLRLANVDDRLTLWVDNHLPFDDGVPYKAARDVVPTKENDLDRPASIGVQGAAVTVRHLRLFRDTYYTTGKNGSPSAADVNGLDPAAPQTWEKWSEAPVATFYVQPGHYLCLGDNSPESSDGRSWGLVPHRLLLGRALLVYYPFGRAGRIR
jgi:signal peptidase I